MGKITPAWDRFWAKVDVADCWVWTAAIGSQGYGLFWPAPKTTALAHRWSYEQLVGPIAPGLHLDHLCRNRPCVNPDHLEPVSPRENLMRGATTQAAKNVAKTDCLRGHPLSGPNLKITSSGRRTCRACIRILAAKYRRQKRVA